MNAERARGADRRPAQLSGKVLLIQPMSGLMQSSPQPHGEVVLVPSGEAGVPSMNTAGEGMRRKIQPPGRHVEAQYFDEFPPELVLGGRIVTPFQEIAPGFRAIGNGFHDRNQKLTHVL